MKNLTEREKIRVHFDLRLCDFKCGINTYEMEITKRLLRYDDIDGDPFYVHRQALEQLPDNGVSVRHVAFQRCLAYRNNSMKHYVKLFSYAGKLLEPFISFNRIIGAKSGDKFVFFENDIPTLPVKGKTIAVLHDIIPLVMGSFSGKSKRNFRRRAKSIVERATQIVTVSEYSRRDIANYFGIDEGRIEVVYSAVEAEKFSRENMSGEYLRTIRNKYALPDKYILHFGSCDPHKNMLSLIKAYAALPYDIRNEYKLFVTNPIEEVINCVNKNGVSSDVLFAEKIPEEDKAGIYQLSSLFAWPSYIEGFGTPILEAQASGIPVILSNTTAMPEVARDAAVYFDPKDVKAMTEAMRKCLTDEALRNDLVAKGYENIKRFSWDKSAEQFHEMLTRL